MEHYSLGKMERRFADLVWDLEPIASGELVKICAEEFDWKKSTTYTVLRKMVGKGLFENEDSMVRAVISKEEFLLCQSEECVEETFGGSLPKFLAAFVSNKKLSEKEIQELHKIIEESRIK